MARLPQYLAKAPVGRTRLSREVLGEHQRDRIVAAATEVFAKRGFQASTVDNIVSAAKIGVGSFYAQFDGKDDCLAAVCESISAEVHVRIAAALHPQSDWGERTCEGLYALLRFVAERPLAARVILLEAQTGGPEALRRYGEMIDEIAAFLRKGRAVGQLDPEPPESFEEATASGLVWLLQGRVVRGETTEVEVDALFAEMAEVALEPYLGAKQTKARIRSHLAASA